MNDFEFFKNLFSLFDTTLALAIAVWIIQIGVTRLDKVLERYESFVKSVMDQQQSNNNELMSLVSTLCINTTGGEDLPKSGRRVSTKAGL